VSGDDATVADGGWSPPSARERWEIIRSTRTVAMVGASDNRSRPSFFVATYLLSSSTDFDAVWFINPKGGEILGQPVYKSLDDLPGVPDLVDVFRKPADLPQVTREAIDIGAKTVWFQLTLANDEAAEMGHAAGLNVVQNRCLKIEHARWAGGLHLAGFDTGVISSKKGV